MHSSVLKNISRHGFKEANLPVLRTHDLEELLALLVLTLPDWSHWQPDFKIITEYAVDARYPSDSATAANAQHARHVCEAVRQTVRNPLKHHG